MKIIITRRIWSVGMSWTLSAASLFLFFHMLRFAWSQTFLFLVGWAVASLIPLFLGLFFFYMGVEHMRRIKK